MKSKQVFLSCVLFFAVATTYAQTSASQAGIAIQGIARDANNTALTSQSLSFTFTIYYFNASNIETEIFSETLNLVTDAFGVFSHIIDPGSVNNPVIANQQAYLRIKNGSVIVSNEKLKHVPYAISANNGVPTGSIMPYLGTTAPEGWALCNGAALPATATDLIAMVGSNAPDLQGMFLRGAGTNSLTSVNTTLKGVQDDVFESHTHPGTTNNDGAHVHRIVVDDSVEDDGDGGVGLSHESDNNKWNHDLASTLSNHQHAFTTNSTGGSETRPINYGVNYIIKL